MLTLSLVNVLSYPKGPCKYMKFSFLLHARSIYFFKNLFTCCFFHRSRSISKGSGLMNIAECSLRESRLMSAKEHDVNEMPKSGDKINIFVQRVCIEVV